MCGHRRHHTILNEKAGLTTKHWQVLRGANAPSPSEIRDEFEKQGLNVDKLEIITRGIDTGSNSRTGDGPRFDDYGAKLMGGPIGSRVFAEQFISDLADHHAAALEAIRVFGSRHPRQAINMLIFCSVPRMQHAYSMVPWDIAHEHYARAHSLILTTAAEILGLSDDEARAQDVRVRLSLPMKYGGLGLADPEVVARHALIGNFTACVNDLKNYAGLTGLGAPVEQDPPPEGTSARARRARARRAPRRPTDDGPCWGAWETTWTHVRGGLQDDLRAAEAALARATSDREAAYAAPVQNAGRCRAADSTLKRATKLRDNLRSALQLFPCEAAEVATTGVHWKERGTQKILSKLAHARVLNDLHKRYLAEGKHTTAATLLSTAAPGAMAWVTFSDQLIKADTLSGDIFRTAMRFSLGLNQPILVAAAESNTPCGHCNDAFPTSEHYQTHALTITDGTAGGSTYNTHNRILEAVANCARAAGASYSVGATQHGIRNRNANCRLGTHTNANGEQVANARRHRFPQHAPRRVQRAARVWRHHPPVRRRDDRPHPYAHARRARARRRSAAKRRRRKNAHVRRSASRPTEREGSDPRDRGGRAYAQALLPTPRHLREAQGGPARTQGVPPRARPQPEHQPAHQAPHW